MRIVGNFAGGREKRVGFESGSGESLEIPTNAEIQGEMAGDADGILGEGRVVVAVGVGGGGAEVL